MHRTRIRHRQRLHVRAGLCCSFRLSGARSRSNCGICSVRASCPPLPAPQHASCPDRVLSTFCGCPLRASALAKPPLLHSSRELLGPGVYFHPWAAPEGPPGLECEQNWHPYPNQKRGYLNCSSMHPAKPPAQKWTAISPPALAWRFSPAPQHDVALLKMDCEVRRYSDAAGGAPARMPIWEGVP